MEELFFVDIWDWVGWMDDIWLFLVKMVVFIVEVVLLDFGVKVMDVFLEGICLILGDMDIVVVVVNYLCDILSVIVLLLLDVEFFFVDDWCFDIVCGCVKIVLGVFGGFKLNFDVL